MRAALDSKGRVIYAGNGGCCLAYRAHSKIISKEEKVVDGKLLRYSRIFSLEKDDDDHGTQICCNAD